MFQFIVLFSALAIAGCAAWFSVAGISQLFLGAPIAAIVMAVSLELGKLVAISYVYRSWKTINKLLRTYMFLGAFILSIITSTGIYAFLTSAYSISAVEFQGEQNKVTLLETQKSTLDQRIVRNDNRLSQLYEIRINQEARLDSLVGRNGFVTQQRVIQSSDTEIERLQQENFDLQKQSDSLALEAQTLQVATNTGSKLGSFSYFAEQMGIDLDTFVRWFILSLVIVFDPMAVALIIAYNSILEKKKEKEEEISTEITQNLVNEVNDDENEKVIIYEPSDEIINDSEKEEKAKIPYYMDPEYDWSNDNRWREDAHAIHYKMHGHRVDK